MERDRAKVIKQQPRRGYEGGESEGVGVSYRRETDKVKDGNLTKEKSEIKSLKAPAEREEATEKKRRESQEASSDEERKLPFTVILLL
ncbi:hypothetical protein PAMP_014736 [Pampus punctatissimus]